MQCWSPSDYFLFQFCKCFSFFFFQNPSVTFTTESKGGSSSKSFSTLVTTPFHSPVVRSVRAKSVESPYTSLGSAHSSYASIRQQPNGLYSSLRAKAERANAMHESKSKGINYYGSLQIFNFVFIRN